MPAFPTPGATPREELGLAIVEGQGAVQGTIGDKLLGGLGINWRNAHMVKATLGGSLGLRHIGSSKYVRAQGTEYQRMSATFGDALLTVTPRGVEIVVPREMVLDYGNRFDVLSFFAGRFGQEIGILTQEYLIAAATIGSGSIYVAGSAANSGVAYTAANRDVLGASGMNPIQDILASIRRIIASGERPDTVVMSGPVWYRVSTCQNTLQFVRGTYSAIAEVNLENFTSVLKPYGIKQVLIGDNYYNSAADGATPSLTAIWSNTYILVCRAGNTGASEDATEGVSVPTLSGIGANVFWNGFDSSGMPSLSKDAHDFTGAGGYYVEQYPDLTRKAEVLRIEMSHNPTITNNRAGDLIATQYS